MTRDGPHPDPTRTPHPAIAAFFAERGWSPMSFQREAWAAQARGESGLVHAATGTGKTLAVWMGAVEEALAARDASGDRKRETAGLRVLWLTPMRALAGDTLKSLRAAAEGVGLDWRVDSRTGDTSSSAKAKMRERMPHALVTTPESLSVLLSYPGTADQLRAVSMVVVDEWHELLGTKRGVQTELCLARLRRLSPGVRTWGLSATMGNLEHAMHVLCGPAQGVTAQGVTALQSRDPQHIGTLIQGHETKTYEVETILPDSMERFPWAGHIGLRLLKPVIERIDGAASTLLFCNTRGQAEIWFQALMKAKPEWLDKGGAIAIHHGSLDRGLRGEVEDRLKRGTLRCVVCTSSLDLGVDYPPVDQVIQVGSAKGVGRFMQRAGRSGHQPGRPSRLVCVPTNAWELVEFAAARRGIAARDVESRVGLRLSLDVLCQHLLTLGVGGGFIAGEVLSEIRTTHAFAGITDEQFAWALEFAARGGASLKAYERYARLEQTDGVFKVSSPAVARLHRLSIGTISSDASMLVKFRSGKLLGTVEESFGARLGAGDVFAFAGRRVQVLKIKDMVLYVQPARAGGRSTIARWNGGRMPLSHELAAEVRRVLAEADASENHSAVDANGESSRGPTATLDPEIACAMPVLRVQRAWSRLPRPGELLIERCTTGEGHHVFVYPLEGRLVHEGLATLLAFRLARGSPRTFSISCNDLGLELLCNQPLSMDEAAWRRALSPDELTEDLLQCLNASALARRQFREIARVAGLLVPGLPGQPRSTRQMQASSELFFDVFEQFDPGNLLLSQAKREVLERQLEIARLRHALEQFARMHLAVVDLPELSPLAFPLWADRLREELTSEKWHDRVQDMVVRLEARADGQEPAKSPNRGIGPSPLATRARRPARRAARR